MIASITWDLKCGKGVSPATPTCMWRSTADCCVTLQRALCFSNLQGCAVTSGMWKPSTRGVQGTQVFCPTRWKMCSHLLWWKPFSAWEDRRPGWIAALESWVQAEANRMKTRLSFFTGLCRRNTLATTSRTGSMCVFTQLWPPSRLEPNHDLSWTNLQARKPSFWKLLYIL